MGAEKNKNRDALMMSSQGHVLLAALMLVLLLIIAGMTSLFLASQDGPGVSAMRADKTAQQLADAGVDLVMSWFHDPVRTPASVAGILMKRQGDLVGGPSFFDAAGRSQFVGTAEQPDVLLDAANPADNLMLNDSPSGLYKGMKELGRIQSVKLYGPMQPGLLSTVEVTATTDDRRPVARTVTLQLGAVAVPAVRAAVEVGQALGSMQPGGESPVLAHWGDQRVMGDLSVRRIEDLVQKSSTAPVTGQSYDQMTQAQDRWTDYWVGGAVYVTSPPPGQSQSPSLPSNVYGAQNPTPGVRLDLWEYAKLKKTALQFGRYYRLDRLGRLHSPGAADSDPGVAPADVLESPSVGSQQGLVFIDTIDGEVPRADNLGTLTVDTDYVEGMLVVQGHVVLRPRAGGKSVPVLSPSAEGTNVPGSRVPVQLSGIHVNGVLYAAGTIMLERSTRLYGAIIAGNTVTAVGTGAVAEVWYNADLAQGLFKGIPVVHRAPGTWLAKY